MVSRQTEQGELPLREARYWECTERGVRCLLCPHYCVVAEGRAGRCRGRRNIGGRLAAESYGRVVSLAVDPIEKKPLYHFLPGSPIMSLATYGCNLNCPFCQNSDISQFEAPSRFVAPDALLRLARKQHVPAVAFTYNEPLTWYEYIVDSARLLRSAGIAVVLVTNGMINRDPLAELLPLVDAMNIDLKSMRPEFYSRYVGGDLETVLGTIRAARQECHVELTNLVIPGRNDTDDDFVRLVDFVVTLGPNTPLHLSRYFPRHRESEPSTPAATLARAAQRAGENLEYVYLGNVDSAGRYRDTVCPECSNVLVDRSGYVGRLVGISHNACAQCGRTVDLVLPDCGQP
jgi:pyruvate formate lyase activating enzyme